MPRILLHPAWRYTRIEPEAGGMKRAIVSPCNTKKKNGRRLIIGTIDKATPNSKKRITTAFYVNFQIFYLKNCIFLIFLSIFAIFGCIV